MIKKVKWDNHAILKNLELDFCKDDGTPYNTIVLAGENGVGKTTILETLATFLNLESFEPFQYLQYEIGDVTYTDKKGTNNSEVGFHIRLNEEEGSRVNVNCGKNIRAAQIKEDTADIRHYGFAYSKARSGFETKEVKTATLEQLDQDQYEIDNRNDFTYIKQLLVDIDDQDSNTWKEISEAHLGAVITDYEESLGMTRFKNAFNGFLQSIQFLKIDTKDPKEKKIIFKKYDNEITIDQLSTGEKQIVFRGTYLLKNLKSINGGVVLIDEPELSLHPSWQHKVLKYYRDLFTYNKTQSVQMIFATHSEFILKAALEDKENILVIALCNENESIIPKKINAPAFLPSVTFAETNYLVFDVVTNDYHIELYEYLKNKSGKNTVAEFDQYIFSHKDYDPLLHGRTSSHGNTIYKTLPTFIRNAIDHPDSSRIFTEEELRLSIELLINMC